MLKRLIEALRWLPKAPTHITNKVPEGTCCDYCAATSGLTNYEDVFCICHECQRRAFDSLMVSIKPRKEKE